MARLKPLLSRALALPLVNPVFRAGASLVLPEKKLHRLPVSGRTAVYRLQSGESVTLLDPLKDQVAKNKSFGQGTQARDLLVDKLLELVEVPVADSVIEDEVHRHLESEGRLEDDEHRAEVTEASTKAFKTQIVLDAIAEKHQVQVSQEELTQYLVQGAAQYGMDPNEFVQILSQNGQIPAMVGEVARNKALAIALGKATVTDAAGNAVDLSEFTAVSDADESEADAAAEAPADAEEAPAEEQKPARKRTAKKADAEEAPADAEAEEPKKPARKRAAKKADAE